MDYDYQKREEKAVAAIKKAIPSSLKQDMLKESKGMFAEMYENKEVFPNHIMGSAIDSVGTKVILAEAMHKYDTIGIDCVAMSANDLATFGKMSPFLFIDCLSVQDKIQEERISGEIIKGIVKGLEECDASSILRNSIRLNFGKGETASVHEILAGPKEGYSFDLVGGMIGFMPKQEIGFEVKEGQKIIALTSSGLHSNGYTDARLQLLNGDFEERPEYKKRYKGKYSLNDEFDGSTIGKRLLEPTKLYVEDMARASKDHSVIGINNTGYGLKNLNRLKGNVDFIITDPIKPQPIFELIQKESGFSDEEMYRKFNMGMGFFIITDDAEAVLQKVQDGKIVGELVKGKGRTILKRDTDIIFEGY
ncbi:phosphoribosylformylglycinamidine cyclo-ligase [Candidatus Woesearchaeota archaeon]|nr:phosphoribosylformylglycinamidine cyclo-ligase [Candidatus Woesearchaeota archaeon]